MTTGIKAIETKYKGYRFRSRLEARWAVFLDDLKIIWEYEKEGFHLEGVGSYLPDFWLPDFNAWLEIKGAEPSSDDAAKVKAFGRNTNAAVFMAVGLPIGGGKTDLRSCFNTRLPNGDFWVCPACDAVQIDYQESLPYLFACVACSRNPRKAPENLARHSVGFPRKVYWDLHRSGAEFLDAASREIRRAAEAARSVRFEFGEQGAAPPVMRVGGRSTPAASILPPPSPRDEPAAFDLGQLQQRWPDLKAALLKNPLDQATFHSCELIAVEGRRLVLRMSSGSLLLLRDDQKREMRGALVDLLGKGTDVRFIDDKSPYGPWSGLGLNGSVNARNG